MDKWIMWGGLTLVVALLTLLNQKRLYAPGVKRAYAELKTLADRTERGTSEPGDLSRWEAALAEMERHPNEYNKLDLEIGLRSHFCAFLEKHAPGDPRLPELRLVASNRKDSVWGIKLTDRDR
ncbi:hypothetical protein [Paenibacillus glufosinatiresistens]|uniref:hypothetical protein n=1 Tax=Paenibacillus glufosinatiresistens TaxID=3070657 RepID=UPI00286E1FC1|nr:hypothetical protein [Paenibacillus sp. YX.27]